MRSLMTLNSKFTANTSSHKITSAFIAKYLNFDSDEAYTKELAELEPQLKFTTFNL